MLENPFRRRDIGTWRVVVVLLILLGCLLMLVWEPEPPAELETGRVDHVQPGQGGIVLPDGGLLALETRESVVLYGEAESVTRDCALAAVDALEDPESQLPAAISRVHIARGDVRLLRIAPDGSRRVAADPFLTFDPPVPHGRLERIREGFFDDLSGCLRNRQILLPLHRAGNAVGDWAVLHAETGSLRGLPRKAGTAEPIPLPLRPASPEGGAAPDTRLLARFTAIPDVVAALGARGELSFPGTEAPPESVPAIRGWDAAPHPRLPLVYLAGADGIHTVPIGGSPEPWDTGGRTFQRILVSPDGSVLLALESGGTPRWIRFLLDGEGRPGGDALSMPPELSRSASVVWEPGETKVAWGFPRSGGSAWRVDVRTGRLLAASELPGGIRLKAAQTGSVPTVVIVYAKPNGRSWEKTLAWLDPESLIFNGIGAPPPLKRLEWTPVEE